MKKIYSFLAAAMVVSGVSAATLEKAPKLSMENATVVGRLENAPMKKAAAANLKKKAQSRAEESDAPDVLHDYMICYSIYNRGDKSTTTQMAGYNNLVAKESENEYKFESFLFQDISVNANLEYDPDFWTDENGIPVGEGEWILSIPLGEDSEPLFYTDFTESSEGELGSNEPVFFRLVGFNNRGEISYYSNDKFEFVVRDGELYSPYVDGVGLGMTSRIYGGGYFIGFMDCYLDIQPLIPNAHGTAIENTMNEDNEIVATEFSFPVYTEIFEQEGNTLLYAKGLCGWPGDAVFLLLQEDGIAYTEDMSLTTIQDIPLYMSMDMESTQIIMDVTKDTTGKSVLSADEIFLVDSEGYWWVYYDNIEVTFDYNIWTGEGEAGIKNAIIDNIDAPAEYYNMQGMKIENPVAGQLYIVKKGNKASKQIIK